jgi:uncharacterized membrane protein
MYQGPLPPANEFERYEQSLPGAAERILALAEKEAAHRHKIEDKAIKLNGIGQLCALAVSVLSLGIVGVSIYFAQPVASIAPAIVAITGLISVFTGKKKS